MILTYMIIFIICKCPNFDFVIILCILSYYHFILLVLLFVIGKDIERIYRHSQSQISTLSLKAPVSSSSETKTFLAILLTTTSVPYATDKHQNIFLYSQNTIQNYETHLRLVNNICVL